MFVPRDANPGEEDRDQQIVATEAALALATRAASSSRPGTDRRRMRKGPPAVYAPGVRLVHTLRLLAQGGGGVGGMEVPLLPRPNGKVRLARLPFVHN